MNILKAGFSCAVTLIIVFVILYDIEDSNYKLEYKKWEQVYGDTNFDLAAPPLENMVSSVESLVVRLLMGRPLT
jgi:hypothetical protein